MSIGEDCVYHVEYSLSYNVLIILDVLQCINNTHLCQAFSELQVKMIDRQQKVKLADLQIEQLNRMKKHSNLTHTEITGLPPNTRMYEGVGRM